MEGKPLLGFSEFGQKFQNCTYLAPKYLQQLSTLWTRQIYLENIVLNVEIETKIERENLFNSLTETVNFKMLNAKNQLSPKVLHVFADPARKTI